MNAAQERLVRGLRSWFFRLVSFHPDDFIPETLYHYTSAAGLHGIVTTGTLWAGNYSFLNDSSELTYGRGVASAVVLRRLEAEKSSRSRSFLKLLHDKLLKATDAVDFYVTCFCRTPDLLSQWRGYGDSQGRYCIGFDGEQLASRDSLTMLKHWSGPVIYDSDRQNTKIDSALRKAQETLEQDGTSSKRFRSAVADVVVLKLVRELCFFKAAGFGEENEWRLVHFLADPANIQFQVTAGLLRPHVVMVTANGDPPILPIVEAIAGGSTFGAQAKKAAELLFQRYGYGHVTVQESSIPFR